MSPITGGALLGDRLRVDFNQPRGGRLLSLARDPRRGLFDTLPTILLELMGGAGIRDASSSRRSAPARNETRIRDHVDRTAVVVVPGMGDEVQMDKAGILEIADEFIINKADFAGENELKRALLDIAAGRPIHETVATKSQGVSELAAALFNSPVGS